MVACTCPNCGTPFIAEEHPSKDASTGLTKSQDKVLAYLERRIPASRVRPTYEDIAVGSGMRSKSRIKDILTELDRRGYIRLRADRTITLVSRGA